MQIYADNAATTKPSKAAVRAMLSCLEQNYGNPSSLHHVGQAAAEALLQARQDIAGCLGCTAREIYIWLVFFITLINSISILHINQF